MGNRGVETPPATTPLDEWEDAEDAQQIRYHDHPWGEDCCGLALGSISVTVPASPANKSRTLPTLVKRGAT
jgi:hypothetical protein